MRNAVWSTCNVFLNLDAGGGGCSAVEILDYIGEIRVKKMRF